jgi:hypothetical protein
MQLFGDETVLEVNRDVTSLRESEARHRWLASIVDLNRSGFAGGSNS